MNSFSTSTHFKNWIKTEEQLEKIVYSKIQKIYKRVKEVNNLIHKENEEKSRHLNDEQNTNFEKYISEKNFFLKPEDEKLFIIGYTDKLIKILNNQSDKSTSLKNTTTSFFRRFFLKKSIIDYDPIFIMAGAFFLGSKINSLHYTQNELFKIFHISKDSWEILKEYEFYLCTVLEYDFYVYNPYQALLGFIYTLDKKEFFISQDKQNYINQDDFKNDCMSIIDKMYLTDNIFIYTYSEIALASIFIQCEYKNINTINISEKLDLDKIIDVKEFIEKQVTDMKKKLDQIPKYETTEEEEKKINKIYGSVKSFLKKFPKYQAQLDKERNNLRNKMKEFDNNFNQFATTKENK